MLWDQVLHRVAAKISKPSYDTWFAATSLKMLDNHTYVICSKNEFASDWLASRYSDLIREIIYEITSEDPTIIFEGQKESNKPLITTDEKIHALRAELTILQDRVRQLENEKNG